MYRLFFVLFLTVCGHVGPGHCRSLVSLQIDSGEWLLVKEVSRGVEYWLYPRPEIQAASWCRSCAQASVMHLSVRFWSPELLQGARSALRGQGWCAEQQPCRVAPFQAARLVLRHPSGRWEPLRRSVALSGILPDVVDFAVRPAAIRDFDNDSVVPLEQLVAFEIDVQLAEITGADASNNRLVITSADLDLALGLLPAKQNKVINQRNLQRLIDVLLKMKARYFDGATVLGLTLRAKLQQQLTTSSMEFRDYLKAFLPSGHHTKPGDVLFVLKQLKNSEKISISIDDINVSKSVTVGVRLHRQLTTPSISQLSNKLQDPTSSALDNNTSLLRQQVEKLASLAGAEHILDPAVMDLRAIDDCFDVQQKKLEEGVFYLRPLKRAVWCTKDGYLVILNRFKDPTNFNLTFRKYEDGIGDVKSKGYFIGLRAVSQVTLADDSCMVLKLYPWRLSITSRTATYDSFTVSDSYEKYKLDYVAYRGTTLTDVLSSSKGQMFTTTDRDHDPFVGNCARLHGSGNWYASCQRINMFGPYRADALNGMCSTGMAKSQGTMCSPLTGVQMLVRKKVHARKSSHIVYSIIASSLKNCTSRLELFNVTEPGLYTITVGGAPGGRSPKPGTRPGGRGAKLSGVFHLKRGAVLALSAGCRGRKNSYAGHGGDASWAVLRPKGVLLIVAGGGGGAGEYIDPKSKKGFTPLAGMHGRATPEGGDAWWQPLSTETYDAKSILSPHVGYGVGEGWQDLREKFLTASSGTVVSSGGTNGGCDCGGGGGGFEGGHAAPFDSEDGGGGGGSLCNNSEVTKPCSVEAGGNTRPDGFVIVERHVCF